jgi:hypothetical protein
MEFFRKAAKNPFRKKAATADSKETSEAFIKELLNKTSADVKATSRGKVVKKIMQIKNLLFTVAIMIFTTGVLQQSGFLRYDFTWLMASFKSDLKQSAQAGNFEIAMGVKAREASLEAVPPNQSVLVEAVSPIQKEETPAIPATSGSFIRQKIDRDR